MNFFLCSCGSICFPSISPSTSIKASQYAIPGLINKDPSNRVVIRNVEVFVCPSCKEHHGVIIHNQAGLYVILCLYVRSVTWIEDQHTWWTDFVV